MSNRRAKLRHAAFPAGSRGHERLDGGEKALHVCDDDLRLRWLGGRIGVVGNPAGVPLPVEEPAAERALEPALRHEMPVETAQMVLCFLEWASVLLTVDKAARAAPNIAQ